MAGVGLGVNVRGLVAVGRRAFGVGLFAAGLLALLSLGLVALLVSALWNGRRPVRRVDRCSSRH